MSSIQEQIDRVIVPRLIRILTEKPDLYGSIQLNFLAGECINYDVKYHERVKESKRI